MSEFLCVGDIVSLYCEETEGYVYNCQTRFTIILALLGPHQIHGVRTIATNVSVTWSLCESVCLSCACDLQKKLDGSTSGLEWRILWAQRTVN